MKRHKASSYRVFDLRRHSIHVCVKEYVGIVKTPLKWEGSVYQHSTFLHLDDRIFISSIVMELCTR